VLRYCKYRRCDLCIVVIEEKTSVENGARLESSIKKDVFMLEIMYQANHKPHAPYSTRWRARVRVRVFHHTRDTEWLKDTLARKSSGLIATTHKEVRPPLRTRTVSLRSHARDVSLKIRSRR